MSNGNGMLDIGPGKLMPEGDAPFLLSRPEFLAVQTYVEAGKFLPKSADEMQSKLGIPASEASSSLQDLIDIYSQIVTHCAYFSATTFPMSVELAGDIVHYNEKVPIYYGALNPIIDALKSGALSEDRAQAKLSAVLGVLRDAAQGYAGRAATVKGKMQDFVEETEDDQSVLESLDKHYEEQLASQDEQIATYTAQIKELQGEIKRWNEQYERDMAAAGAAATYAWILPVGAVAAAIVAGVYGQQATDALDKINAYNDKLAATADSLRKSLHLVNTLKLAEASLEGILGGLSEGGLSALAEVEDAWKVVVNNLTLILDAIDESFNQAVPMIRNMGVAEAIRAWNDVAGIAGDYRSNAYISVQTEDEIKQEAAADPEKYAVPQAA